jgi:hypothetical protein
VRPGRAAPILSPSAATFVQTMSVAPTSAPDISLPDRIDTDVVVLPREVDEHGTGLYDDSVLTLAKALRAEGVSADYQHDREHRNWIGERDAGAIALAVVLGIASNAGWHALIRLFSKTQADDHVRGKVARCTQRGETIVWEWYEFEGQGEEVARALELIGPSPEPPQLEP